MREDESAPLSMEELDTMIEKIEKASLQRAKEKAKTEYGVIHDDIRLISSTLTSIVIDGKNVTHAIGLPGKYVRIHVLNIFAPASEYNVLRSIIASLKKRPISLVPIPLLFSKIIEKTKMSEEETIFIDIGYTHVTIVFQKNQEITFFDTFEIGSKMLIDILQSAFPDMSYTAIENLLMRQNPTSDESLARESATSEYLSYVIDTFLSVLVRSGEMVKMQNICIS
jgi:cell division ATPase FtsA